MRHSAGAPLIAVFDEWEALLKVARSLGAGIKNRVIGPSGDRVK
jgi:hypothetical protein